MTRATHNRQAGPSSRLLEGLPLVHEEMPAWIDEFLERRRLTWQQLERGELWAGRLPFENLDELQLYLICADPVRWAECHLIEKPEDGGAPWRLWDYQKPALRWRGRMVLTCGAETGKTRNIIAKAAYYWDSAIAIGSQLVCASQDGQLDLLYDDLLFYLQANPRLNAQIDTKRTRVKPYKKLYNKAGGVIHFRPAGDDGESYRSVHVSLRAYHDESAKPKNPRVWLEFFRAMKVDKTRGIEATKAPWELYSTPDGDQTSEFHRLKEQGVQVEWDPEHPERVEAFLATLEQDPRSYPTFRWSQTYKPTSDWNDERELQAIDEYGGVDSDGYQQNVYGLDGDPSNAVFPWSLLGRSLGYIDRYVTCKLTWDSASEVIHLEAYRLNPEYSLVGSESAPGEDSEGAARTIRLAREQVPLSRFDHREVLQRFFAPLPGPAVVGIDVGADGGEPTEILFFDVLGLQLRLVARIHLKRFETPHQRRILADAHDLMTPSYGCGLDATGIGSAVEHEVRDNHPDLALDLSGFVLNAATLDRSPSTGEVKIDPDTRKEVRTNYKELSTRLLEHALNHSRLKLPFDPDIIREWQSHRVKINKLGTRSFLGPDHTIDAARCAALRRFLLEHGGLAVRPVTFASVPRGGLARDSSRLGHRRPGLASTSGGLGAALSDYTGSGPATSRSRTSRASTAVRALGDW